MLLFSLLRRMRTLLAGVRNCYRYLISRAIPNPCSHQICHLARTGAELPDHHRLRPSNRGHNYEQASSASKLWEELQHINGDGIDEPSHVHIEGGKEVVNVKAKLTCSAYPGANKMRRAFAQRVF